MANPYKAEVKVRLLDGDYILRFDTNAVASLEEVFKQPVHKFLEGLGSNIGVSVLRTLLFYGLQRYHHDQLQSLQQAGDLMDLQKLADYGQAVGRALMLAITGKEPGEEKAEADPLPQTTPEEPGTGEPS